jgi:hypothetical protein
MAILKSNFCNLFLKPPEKSGIYRYFGNMAIL